jgi:hypothetical protein
MENRTIQEKFAETFLAWEIDVPLSSPHPFTENQLPLATFFDRTMDSLRALWNWSYTTRATTEKQWETVLYHRFVLLAAFHCLRYPLIATDHFYFAHLFPLCWFYRVPCTFVLELMESANREHKDGLSIVQAQEQLPGLIQASWWRRLMYFSGEVPQTPSDSHHELDHHRCDIPLFRSYLYKCLNRLKAIENTWKAGQKQVF